MEARHKLLTHISASLNRKLAVRVLLRKVHARRRLPFETGVTKYIVSESPYKQNFKDFFSISLS